MSLSKHPHVLRVRGSWVQGSKLYIAMRLMKGSVRDLMDWAWPGGVSEEVGRCILRQALEGLDYLHTNGFIHRDIKAANLLIDDDGTVLLGDLGVAVSMLDDAPPSTSTSTTTSTPRFPASSTTSPTASAQGSSGTSSRGRTAAAPNKRRSFVGTPSWMAPEVVLRQAYDSSADIWSFGILCLEIAHGRAPLSRLPPSEILHQTLSRPAPTLDLSAQKGEHSFSAAFKAIIDRCLQKDPRARPTARELLDTPFFRGARKKQYLVSTVLRDLPPAEKRLERRQRVDHQQPPLSVGTTGSGWDFDLTLARSPVPLSPGGREGSPGGVAPGRGRGVGMGVRRVRSWGTTYEPEGRSADRASWSFTSGSASPSPSPSAERTRTAGTAGGVQTKGSPSASAMNGKEGEDEDEEQEQDEEWEPEPFPQPQNEDGEGKTPTFAPSAWAGEVPPLPTTAGLGLPALSLLPPASTSKNGHRQAKPDEREKGKQKENEDEEESDVHTPLNTSRRPSMTTRAVSASANLGVAAPPTSAGQANGQPATGEKERERERKGLLGSFRRRLSSSGQTKDREKGLVGGLLKIGKRNVT